MASWGNVIAIPGYMNTNWFDLISGGELRILHLVEHKKKNPNLTGTLMSWKGEAGTEKKRSLKDYMEAFFNTGLHSMGLSGHSSVLHRWHCWGQCDARTLTSTPLQAAGSLEDGWQMARATPEGATSTCNSVPHKWSGEADLADQKSW